MIHEAPVNQLGCSPASPLLYSFHGRTNIELTHEDLHHACNIHFIPQYNNQQLLPCVFVFKNLSMHFSILEGCLWFVFWSLFEQWSVGTKIISTREVKRYADVPVLCWLIDISLLRLNVSRVFKKRKSKATLPPLKCSVVTRMQGGVNVNSAVNLEILPDRTPHPRITHLHLSQSRDGNREGWSAVEYKVRQWRNEKPWEADVSWAYVVEGSCGFFDSGYHFGCWTPAPHYLVFQRGALWQNYCILPLTVITTRCILGLYYCVKSWHPAY